MNKLSNKIKRIVPLVLVFGLMAISSQVKTYPHISLKGLFEVLKVDDIGFAHALLHSKWIENVYQFAQGKPHQQIEMGGSWRPEYKGDKIANLIRMLWFRRSANHQLLPTKFSFLANIPQGQLGILFGRFINYLYRDCSQEHEMELIDELSMYDPRTAKINGEIEELSKEFEYKKKQLLDKRFAGLSGAIKTFREKLKKLEKKDFKIIKVLEKEAFSRLPRQVLDLRQEYERIAKEINLLKDKIHGKRQKKRLMVQKELFAPICQALEFCCAGQKYAPRTVYAIIWALFFHRLERMTSCQEQIKAINDCINQIDDEFKCEGFSGVRMLQELYEEKDFQEFEKELEDLDFDRQVDKINKNYDEALHYFISLLVCGKFSPEIEQGDYGYEYELGKLSHTRPDCHETAMLDALSLLWYNPKIKAFDDSLFTQEVIKNGQGLQRLREALIYLYLADSKGISPKEYSCICQVKMKIGIVKDIEFTSLEKLKRLEKISPEEVRKVSISEVPVSYITRPEIKQEFFNIISSIEEIIFCSEVEGKTIEFEACSDTRNVLTIFNYFYGTEFISIEQFGGIEAGIFTDGRVIGFELKDKGYTPNEIEISVMTFTESGHLESFEMTIHIDIGHTYITLPERKETTSKIIKTGVVTKIVDRLLEDKLQDQRENTFVDMIILPFLSSNNILKKKNIRWTLPVLNLIHYSLELKTPEGKLELIKSILIKGVEFYNNCKDLVHNLIDAFPLHDQYLRGQLSKNIVESGFHKNITFFERFTQKVSKDIFFYDAINTTHEEEDALYIYNQLIAEINDINKGHTIVAAISKGYRKLVELITQRSEFSIYKNPGLFNATVLKAVVRNKLTDIALEIVSDENFDASHAQEIGLALLVIVMKRKMDEIDEKIMWAVIKNKTFNASCILTMPNVLRILLGKEYKKIALAIINHETFNARAARSVLEIAMKKGYEGIVMLLLSKMGQ